jgi:mono/diheme cytochrome c family protein
MTMKKFDKRKPLLIFLAVGTALLIPICAVADDLETGKAVYNGIGTCSSCHGALGKGDGVAAASLEPKPRSLASGNYKFDTDKDGKSGTEADVFDVISRGAAAFGGSPLMAGRADIPEADRKALAKYVLSLKEK